MSARTTGADATPNGQEAKHRQHHDGSAGRPFTVEQKAAVIRIQKCSPTAFYEILGLEDVRTTCSDSDIKKAYRKLSLLTHPDKNGYEGADEAFKMVSRAFQVLSDPDKKAKYDKFGGDPDSRFGGASAQSPFSNFARASGAGTPRPGQMWEDEISPEEMFRQFFGGMGGFGGPFGGGFFDTGPGFVFNIGGGPGIRVHQFGGPRPRPRPRPAQADPLPTATSTLSSLLPLLLLFLLPVLSSIFSGPSTPTGPSLRFDMAKPPHTQQRVSARIKVPYWVNPSEVEDFSPKKLRELDRTADVRYVNDLNVKCQVEEQQKERLLLEAQGWLFRDEEKVRLANRLPMRSCRKLDELGYRSYGNEGTQDETTVNKDVKKAKVDTVTTKHYEPIVTTEAKKTKPTVTKAKTKASVKNVRTVGVGDSVAARG